MIMDKNGGYEYDFVDVPPDRVLCKICHNPCRDAYLTGCCGTNFCFSCLQRLKKGTTINKACPICRQEKFRIFPNKGLDREIKAFRVYCENHKGGCTWRGEVNDVENHITADCQFVEVSCPSKCGLKLKRQCVEEHVAKECPCYCQYCGTTGNKAEIAVKHKTRCPQYPLPCPNGCKLGVVPSAGMAAHRKVCPLELVQCEYFVVGCESLVARGDLEKHYNQRMAEHLSLMKSKLASAAKTLAESERKFINVGKELGIAKKTMNDTKSTCGKLAEAVSETKTELRWLIDEEYPSMKDEVNNLGFTTAMHCEQAVTASFHTNVLFSRYNACILAIIILFTFAYITQLKLTNKRLLQSEQYTWPKTLDYISEVSTSNRIVPFTFKVHSEIFFDTSTRAKFTFSPLNAQHEVLLTVEYSKKEMGVLVSLSFDKSKLREINEWPLKTMFIVELLNQHYNDDHYIIPIIVNIDFDKICRLSRDDTVMICTIHFISIEHLVAGTDQYLNNKHAYFRVSQLAYSEGVWNMYSLIGPTVFNLLLSYKLFILWITIGGFGVTVIFVYRTAWFDANLPIFRYLLLPIVLIILLWSITLP